MAFTEGVFMFTSSFVSTEKSRTAVIQVSVFLNYVYNISDTEFSMSCCENPLDILCLPCKAQCLAQQSPCHAFSCLQVGTFIYSCAFTKNKKIKTFIKKNPVLQFVLHISRFCSCIVRMVSGMHRKPSFPQEQPLAGSSLVSVKKAHLMPFKVYQSLCRI